MKFSLVLLCALEAHAAFPVQNLDEVYDEATEQHLVEAQFSFGEMDPTVQLAGGRGAPVWGPFISNLRSCAPGCVPADYSTFRKSRGCHGSGRAIDVGALVCGGHKYRAISGGKFAQVVSCMKSKMYVIYRNGKHVTRGHHDHAHFSTGCSSGRGGFTY